MTPLATFIAGTVTGFLLCAAVVWWLRDAAKTVDDFRGENVDEG